MMVLHPIYQYQLEGGYDPLVYQLQHPIYQCQLEGGYDPLFYQLQLKGCYNTLFTNANWKEATTPWSINYN